MVMSEQALILPICLTIDTSYSMVQNGALQAVESALPELKQMLEDDPIASELARVGIVTFSDLANEVLPLTDLAEVSIPGLEAGNGTSYSAGLYETRAFLDRGIKGLGTNVQYYTPIVFFLTDGEPLDSREEWMVEAQALRSDGKYRANVVCFGFADAKPDVLSQIGTTFIAKTVDPVKAVREIFKQLLGSIKTTSASVREGAPGGLLIDPSIKNEFAYIPMAVNAASG
jgi:uncharacterized protein YegL